MADRDYNFNVSKNPYKQAQYQVSKLGDNPAVQKAVDLGNQIGIDKTVVDKLIRYYIIEPNNPTWENERKRGYLGTWIDKYVFLKWYDEGIEYNIFLDIAWINVNRSKNIIRTPIIGRVGTIKEYLYTDDAQITLTGQFVASMKKNKLEFGKLKNNYPKEDLEKLYKLEKHTGTVEITSKVLNEMGIQECVIDNININESQNYTNAVDFSITLWSDDDEDQLLTNKSVKTTPGGSV